MNNLSPAAQAVFDAVRIHWETSPVKEQQWCIACVLRAAAEQIEDQYCDSDIDDSDGAVFVLRRLMLLADELEAAK